MTGTSTFSTSTRYCGLREHLHALLHDLRLLPGVLETAFVAALRIVADNLEEERDLVGLALGADALDEGVLHIVDGTASSNGE